MARWRRLGLPLILLLCAATSTHAAEPRTALVIGNAAYKTSPLRNPVNDARGIADLLQRLGFDVIVREDADERTMKQAIGEFGDRLRRGGIGLFYYSGHGLQVKGSNYLVPVDAEIRSEAQVGLNAVNVSEVLGQMEDARNRVNVVILDACRDNPFARSFRTTSRGLASIDAPGGTLIAYATAPGRVADDGAQEHGLYTGELLKAMPEPGLEIEAMFKRVRVAVSERSGDKQVPWESSSLRDRFFFVPGSQAGAGDQPPEAAPKPPERVQPGRADQAVELAFWDSIKDSLNPNLFQEYLRKYPEGHFTAIALAKIDELKAPRPPETPLVPPTRSNLPLIPDQPLAPFDDEGDAETEDFGVPPQSTLRLDALHAPTPLTVPGAITITTNQLRAMLSARDAPILIDVLTANPGHATIPGAVWMPLAGTGAAFTDQIQRSLNTSLGQLVRGNRNAPIVFFCLGVDCWLSYNAVLRALRLGYRNVYWYRGGITSWQDAGFPTEASAMARW